VFNRSEVLMTNYIKIEDVTGEQRSKVRQRLKFPTGNFVWRVKFNLPLSASSVNNQSCYVIKPDGSLLKTAIHYNSREHMIEITPLDPYARNETYILTVTTKVSSLSGKRLKQDIQIRFQV